MEMFSNLFGNLWSALTIVLFFGGSIFVHELGHFLAARWRGVKVSRFSIGFGPKIVSWTRNGVEYCLSWLPLGGYVALPQLADMAAIEGDSGEVEKLPPVSYSTRIIVFAAGAFFNVLFAFGLATVLWIIGQPTSEELATTQIGYVTKTINLADGTAVKSPALEADLRPGDTIRALDGTRVTDWSSLLQTLVTSAGVTEDGRRKTIFTIERDGRPMDISVYPRLAGEDGVRKVGIVPAYSLTVASVPENSPARVVGLLAGDRLKSVNGAPLFNPLTLIDALQVKEPREITLTVLRNGHEVDLKVPADRTKDASALFGATYRSGYALIHTNPVDQLATQATMTFRVLWSLVQPHSDIGISKLSGPVGIGKIYWDAAQAGIRAVLWIAILVNVNLAIFNLLPIPVLDGGHMLFATIGKIRGRALPVNLIATAQSIFIMLLFGMILYVSVFDVRRIMRDSRNDTQAKEAAAEAKKAAEPAKP